MNFGFVLFSLFVLMISSENVGSNINKLSLKCGQDGHKCSLLIAQNDSEDKSVDARILFCKENCIVSANGKLYVCKAISYNNADSVCEMKPFSLNDLIIKKVFEDEEENSEEQDDDDDDDDDYDERSLFGSGTFLRGSQRKDKMVRMGKRRLPFETLNYGKRRLPFETLNYGKRRLPFETLNYGKRRLPFETLNYGKRRLPFETMNYGKRYENAPFEGYILGRELGSD